MTIFSLLSVWISDFFFKWKENSQDYFLNFRLLISSDKDICRVHVLELNIEDKS